MQTGKPTAFSLMLRLSFMYVLALVFGGCMITLKNLYVNGITLSELWEFNLKALLIGIPLFILLLQVITYWRLRPVMRYIGGSTLDSGKEIIMARMLRFPAELFWGVTILSLIFSILFHTADLIYYGISPGEADKALLLGLINTTLSEQALALTISILLYTMTRSSLRPYINQLHILRIGDLKKESLVKPILIYFISCFIIVILNLLLYMYDNLLYNEPIELPVLFWMTGLYFLFATLLFTVMIIQLRKELRTMVEGIGSLTKGDRNKLHSQIAIYHPDEMGQLADAFNELQDQISKEYDELDKELELAYMVQQQLLPGGYHEVGEYRICAICEQIKEVGGDLYDIVQLDEQRLAVIVGDVSGKGIQAALVMSAVMVLFRTEIRQGGSAGEVLGRLNRMLADTLQGDMMITLGLAICEIQTGMVEYASAGHVSPYSVRGSKVEQHRMSSFPLGIDSDQHYSEIRFVMAKGEYLILYTDGIVKSMNPSRENSGFEQLESVLASLPADGGVQRLVADLFDSLQQSVDQMHADDCTLVMIKRE